MAPKRSLAEKLGLKEGFKITIINPPGNYDTTLGELPKNISISGENGSFDLIQFFTRGRKELEDRFPELMRRLSENGMLWISWPKGSPKDVVGLNEDIVRDIGLKHGLVDVKVIAVDNIWSGLKFVHRRSQGP